MNKISFYTLILIVSCTCISLYAQTGKKGEGTTSVNAGPSVFYHTIERGQTVYAIATMYGVSVEDIYRLNPESKDCIKVGFTLKIPQKKKNTQLQEGDSLEYSYHTIQPQETLYSLSIRYNVPADAIINANPGLSTKTFTIGKNIRIPHIQAEEKIVEKVKTVQKDTPYTVREKDTKYSICRRFDITEEQLLKRNPSIAKKGLQAGMTIYIPEKFEIVISAMTERPKEQEVNALLHTNKEIQQIYTVKAALMLPFSDPSANGAQPPRYIEYYEGVLLAIDSLRNQGCSIDLSVFDTGSGTRKIKNILKDPEMKNTNLIIGGIQNDQIKLIADFAQQNNIKYVIPFTSKNDDVLSNANIFQINTPHSYLYAKAAQVFCKMFYDYNVILLKFDKDKDDKKDFIKTLKMELKNAHIPYKEMDYTAEFVEKVNTALSTEKPNVIVPTTGSMEALSQILSPLHVLVNTQPEYRLSLFGYPEWQTYTMDFLEEFYALDTYIYSYFYADNMAGNVKNFYHNYKKWFSKSLVNTFPKYGMLGFDTGLYFFSAIRKYGENFEDYLSQIPYYSLQTGFNFERVNNWGGFINTNLFIIHYKKNFTVTKTEVNHP